MPSRSLNRRRFEVAADGHPGNCGRVAVLNGRNVALGQTGTLGQDQTASVHLRTTAAGGGFNRSIQHTMTHPGRKGVSNEVPDTSLLRRQSETGASIYALSTFKRDYKSRMDLCDAPTVLAQLAKAFKHFNGIHPHSSLGMLSPKECRKQRNHPAPPALA